MAEAARWTQMTHILGLSNQKKAVKKRESLLSEFMGSKPIVKPDVGANLNKKASKGKLLIDIKTRAGRIQGYKITLGTHGRGGNGSTPRGCEFGWRQLELAWLTFCSRPIKHAETVHIIRNYRTQTDHKATRTGEDSKKTGLKENRAGPTETPLHLKEQHLESFKKKKKFNW